MSFFISETNYGVLNLTDINGKTIPTRFAAVGCNNVTAYTLDGTRLGYLNFSRGIDYCSGELQDHYTISVFNNDTDKGSLCRHNGMPKVNGVGRELLKIVITIIDDKVLKVFPTSSHKAYSRLGFEGETMFVSMTLSKAARIRHRWDILTTPLDYGPKVTRRILRQLGFNSQETTPLGCQKLQNENGEFVKAYVMKQRNAVCIYSDDSVRLGYISIERPEFRSTLQTWPHSYTIRELVDLTSQAGVVKVIGIQKLLVECAVARSLLDDCTIRTCLGELEQFGFASRGHGIYTLSAEGAMQWKRALVDSSLPYPIQLFHKIMPPPPPDFMSSIL